MTHSLQIWCVGSLEYADWPPICPKSVDQLPIFGTYKDKWNFSAEPYKG